MVVNPANENELVHMIGKATTDDDVNIPGFSYSRPNVYSITLVAEMFQQYEIVIHHRGGRDRRPSPPSYIYRNGWKDFKIDSGKFHIPSNTNPDVEWPANSRTVTAQKVQFGAF